MKASVQQLYFFKRPFVVLTALWVIYNASRFDDVKFTIIMASLFGVFILDILESHGEVRGVVEKGLETIQKIKGKNGGNN